jgi:HD-like signal output (HDOD) protein
MDPKRDDDFLIKRCACLYSLSVVFVRNEAFFDTYPHTTMSIDAQLRSLNIDIPAQPESLVQLSELLGEMDVNLQAVSRLIESDMALAAAVMKAVNSSMYGLSGRVQSVHQAVTYLGTREVVAVTFAMVLKAMFPAAPELNPVWQRAAVRGLLMGRIGAAISVDPWAAHSAGLFEECGKAVLFKHDAMTYRQLLALAQDDVELLELEHETFGITSDVLGAALCESWGLAPAAVHSVRYHVSVNAKKELPTHEQNLSICALSAVANALMADPDSLDEVAQAVAVPVGLEAAVLVQGARKVQAQIEAAVARGEHA